MNKIIEEARELGISLVGWVEIKEGFARVTHDGILCKVVAESSPDEGSWCWTAYVDGKATAHGNLDACLYHASIPAKHGGWAPAPIGYVPAPPEVKG